MERWKVAESCISETMTYMMWFEEHFWNASVVQRVYLSNFTVLSSHRHAKVATTLFPLGYLTRKFQVVP